MLELKNVCKTYQGKAGSPSVKALDDISLKFDDTGMVFVLGKSGSGKSTLLNVVGGLDRYDSGEIIIKGKSSREFTQGDFDSYRNTFIGFIFQEYNVLNEFTVGANIALAMELQGKKATSEALNDILDQVDLRQYASRKPATLSGGQKQRVAIARALIKNPEIIMADEPTGALDSATGKQVFDTLKKLSETKLVIVVSHDRDFAEQYGDRIIEFKDGKIISDVTKHKAAPKSLNEGVSVIDGKILHVKKGYKLTNADLKMINEYLAQADSDVVISTDADSNTRFKQVARIDDEGKKETFADTDTTKVGKEYDPKQFKLIRSRLPIGKSIKMGASSLKAKPIRLIFTILLCCVSFTLFGLADTMAAYNKVVNARDSIIDTGIKTAWMQKGEKYRVDDTYVNKTLMSDQDLAKLKEKTGVDFKPVYAANTYMSYEGESLSFSGMINKSDDLSVGSSSYYMGSFNGVAALNSQDIDAMGYTILRGNLPVADDEVMISKYVYDHFKLGGYKYTETGSDPVVIEPNDVTEGDMIGRPIRFQLGDLGNVTFRISGIVDTKVPSTFDDLKPKQTSSDDNQNNRPSNDDSLALMLKMNSYKAEMNGSIHRTAIIRQSTLNAMLAQNQKLGFQANSNGYIGMNENERGGHSFERVAKSQTVTAAGYRKYAFGDEQANTVYCSWNSLPARESYDYDSGQDIRVQLKQQHNQGSSGLPYITYWGNVEHLGQDDGKVSMNALKDVELWLGVATYRYVYENLTALPEGVETAFRQYNAPYYGNPTEDELRKFYARYLMSFTIETRGGGFFDNEIDPNGKCGYDLLFEGLEDFKLYLNDLYIMNGALRVRRYTSDYDESFTVNVGGIYIPTKAMMQSLDLDNNNYDILLCNEQINDLLISDADWVDLFDDGNARYCAAIAAMPSDNAGIDKILNVHYEKSLKVYVLTNTVNSMLSTAETMIEMFKKVFLYIGIGFAVFAALMMFNFIAVSINMKKREIGILRAVGARSSDVFGIFFNESLIITLINYVISVAVTLFAVFGINRLLRNEVGLIITLLHFGVRQLLLMLGVSLLVAFVASFLPVYRIAKKRPIDAIRG